MRENWIQFFDVNPFADTASLSYIDLAENEVRGWRAPLLSSSPKMRQLNLANNQISTVTEALLKDIAPLEEINLLSNPLDCDCRLLPIKTYILHNESRLNIKVDYCSSPDEWRFSPIDEFLMDPNQHCEEVSFPIYLSSLISKIAVQHRFKSHFPNLNMNSSH